MSKESNSIVKKFDISNRRYTGSKLKLADWIFKVISNNCSGNSFCDVFSGTGIISKTFIDYFDTIHCNDFLYSNEVVYKAFWGEGKYSVKILEEYRLKYSMLENIPSNYVSTNYGGKFFSDLDAKIIGYIREDIENNKNSLTEKEYNILLASLLYSLDRIANTVGHYDAYIKNKKLKDKFIFDLIEPIDCKTDMLITREDANKLVRNIEYDVFYIDPPYNSRQYSRFYHIWENIAKWEKPKLYGTALKPIAENMSEYCRASASRVFEELINSINGKYIVVSYNNTYSSKSSSSRNKIDIDEIIRILTKKGELQGFEKEHSYFNAGKTDFNNHKEFLFVVKIGEKS